MSAARTPGSWRIETTSYGIQIHAGHVCQPVYVAETGCDGEPKSGNEAADARLISAAPDLLRVAELLVNWLDEEPSAHKLCDAARAAIARATGAP